MKMPKSVLNVLTEKEDHKHFDEYYSASKWLREKLIQGLTQELEAVTIEAEDKQKALTSPDYAVTQAYLNGEKRGIRRMIQLLSLDQD